MTKFRIINQERSRLLHIFLPRSHQIASRVIITHNNSTSVPEPHFFRFFPYYLGEMACFWECALSTSVLVILDLVIPGFGGISTIGSSRSPIYILSHTFTINIGLTVLELVILSQVISPSLCTLAQPLRQHNRISMMFDPILIMLS